MRATSRPAPTLKATDSLPGEELSAIGLEARVVTITPAMARDWLKKNKSNRSIKRAPIARFARDMGTGNWSLTGECIIFDSKGILRNGQHRLLACEKSEASFTSVVVWGVDPLAFRDMDRNAVRSNGDMLTISGVEGGDAVSKVVSYVHRWLRGGSLTGGGVATPTASECEDILGRFPEIADSVTATTRIRKGGQANLGVNAALAAYLYFRLSRAASPADADVFFEAVYTQAVNGVGLDVGHPAKALYAALTNARVNRRNLRPQEVATLFTRAWNKWRAGEEVVMLRAVGPTPEPHD